MLFLQMSNPRVKKLLLYVFVDNKAVIKMIIKGRSPTLRHVSRTHRVALDWLFDRINLDPKIQIKYIDTKNQLAELLTKGNFTLDEWNHLLTLFNISHFSSTSCIAAMAKRAQQDSGEERVTAKSRPMMNLIARTPSVVSSSSSVSPEKKHHGDQDPLKSVVENDRPGQPGRERELLGNLSSTDYSKLDYDRAWSSQERRAEGTTHYPSGQPDKVIWRMLQHARPGHEEILLDGTAQSVRCGETFRDRSGRPDNINSQEVAHSKNFIMRSDAPEFVNRVNDQVRKRQKNVQRCRPRRRTFCNLGNVYGRDDEFSDFHGKEFPRQSEFHYEQQISH